MAEFDNVTFEELKSLYEAALAERDAVNTKITDIRNVFVTKFDALEELRNSFCDEDEQEEFGDETDEIDAEEEYDWTEADETPEDKPSDDFVSVDFRGAYSFFVSYILPLILVILAVLVLVKILPSFAAPKSATTAAVSMVLTSIGDCYDSIA